METKSLVSISAEDEELGSKLGRKCPFSVRSGRFGMQCPENEAVLLKGQFEFLCFIVIKMFMEIDAVFCCLWNSLGQL